MPFISTGRSTTASSSSPQTPSTPTRSRTSRSASSSCKHSYMSSIMVPCSKSSLRRTCRRSLSRIGLSTREIGPLQKCNICLNPTIALSASWITIVVGLLYKTCTCLVVSVLGVLVLNPDKKMFQELLLWCCICTEWLIFRFQ